MAQNINISCLTFKLNEKEFAVRVNQVYNIYDMLDPVQMNEAPDYLLGAVNLRGMVFPVIDTHKLLGIGEAKITYRSCIVAFEIAQNEHHFTVGAVIDEVLSVVQINKHHIEPIALNTHQHTCLTGNVNREEKHITLLDMQKAFSEKELEILRNKTKQAALELL